MSKTVRAEATPANLLHYAYLSLFDPVTKLVPLSYSLVPQSIEGVRTMMEVSTSLTEESGLKILYSQYLPCLQQSHHTNPWEAWTSPQVQEVRCPLPSLGPFSTLGGALGFRWHPFCFFGRVMKVGRQMCNTCYKKPGLSPPLCGARSKRLVKF